MWQQAPGIVTAEHVQDGIEKLAHRVDPRPAPRLGRRHVRFETASLGVSDSGRIMFSVVDSPYNIATLVDYHTDYKG
jgi:hypothetical protein